MSCSRRIPQEGAVWANQAALGPPRFWVAEVIGYLKGKSWIWIAQNVEHKLRNFLGHKFLGEGYFVSTVGRDEEMHPPLHQKSGNGRQDTAGPATTKSLASASRDLSS